MFDLKQMQQMQVQMQERLAKAQEALKEKKAEGTAGGGAVKVVCDGNQAILSAEIRKGVVELDDEDREMLQDLFIAAANQALEASKKINQESLGSVTGGLRIPGLTI